MAQDGAPEEDRDQGGREAREGPERADAEDPDAPLAPGEPEALGAEDTAGPPPLERVESEPRRSPTPTYASGEGKLGPDEDAEDTTGHGSAGRGGPRRERGGGGEEE